MVSITLHDVTKRYATTAAVDGISLRIEPGELFFLLGPSGCGKSTLLRMVAGLATPTSGMIRFGDQDVTRMPARQRNAAMVFQGYALWPHMTVAQNVAFGLDVRKTPRREKAARVAETLAMVQLEPLAQRRPAQLSGGQQQRVALARAIVVRPDVLLLDEPLSNLDAKLRNEMRGEIHRICRQAKITTLYVTHDQEEALSMADRIALLSQGKLCQLGTPTQLYDGPVNSFAAGFIGQTNLIPGVVQQRNANGATVATLVGKFQAADPAATIREGDPVVVLIRPESFRAAANAEADLAAVPNRVTGRCVEIIYLGHSVQGVMECQGGVRIRFVQQAHLLPVMGGNELTMTCEAQSVIILPRDRESACDLHA